MLSSSLDHEPEIWVFLSCLLRLPVFLPLNPALSVLLQLAHWAWAAPDPLTPMYEPLRLFSGKCHYLPGGINAIV